MDASLLRRDGLPGLAYVRTSPAPDNRLPTLMFCGGFRSDMEGTKALFLEQRARIRGQGFIRFDYSGHGRSEGRFEDGTIGGWTADALAVLDTLTRGPAIVIGSSMGGWIALHLALARPDRVAGIVGVAAAPDFTRWIKAAISPEQHRQLEQTGRFDVPSDYGAPYPITHALLEDGESHCLLDRRIAIACPVRLLQGMEDPDVPWQTAHRIRNAMAHPKMAEVVLIEHGDHRLSRPQDLERIAQQADALSEQAGA